MHPTEPLPLNHSWPLFERDRRFGLGHVSADMGDAVTALSAASTEEMIRAGIGFWECNLSDNALSWTPQVHDIFGLPRDITPLRAQAVTYYAEHSRAIMERLRAYAVKHRRGFTVDSDIRSVHGIARRMRLIAAPICEGGRVVRLQGLKFLI